MELLPLLLVLAAACAHASWNIIAHGTSSSGPAFLWWGSVVAAVMLAMLIPFTGGWGTDDLFGILVGAVVSAALNVAAFVLLQKGYVTGDLSTVYAVARGTGPLLTVIAAVTLLGESISTRAVIGVIAVVIGIVAIGLINRGTKARNARADLAIMFGLLTGVCIAAYTVWDAFAIRHWHISPVAYLFGCFALEIPVISAVFLRKQHRKLIEVWHQQRRQLLLFGIISPLSYLLVLFAITLAPVSLVAPVREVSVILVCLWGVFVLREGRPALRLGASAVVVAGVVMLAL